MFTIPLSLVLFIFFVFSFPVRPLKMDVTGVVGHVVSGTKILLECKVSAARPAANVTWYNGTELLSDNSERTDVFETKTIDNVSEALF